MHSVTDVETDGQTDDKMMPISAQYDRQKSVIHFLALYNVTKLAPPAMLKYKCI